MPGVSKTFKLMKGEDLALHHLLQFAWHHYEKKFKVKCPFDLGAPIFKDPKWQ